MQFLKVEDYNKKRIYVVILKSELFTFLAVKYVSKNKICINPKFISIKMLANILHLSGLQTLQGY